MNSTFFYLVRLAAQTAFIAGILFVTAASGAELASYSSRILSVEADIAAGIEDADAVNRETIAGIRNKLPATERIDWPGGSVNTENTWLHQKLDEFENERDDSKRTTILKEIGERLSAISLKIRELETSQNERISKDEEKRKLAGILNRAEYQKPQAQEESMFQRWLRKFVEWIESWLPKPGIPGQSVGGLGSLAFVLQILLFTAVAALLGFGIYKFAPVLFPAIRRKRKSKNKERVILGERIAADASSSDLFGEAEQMALRGDLRGAVRKGYIALLCELSDRKIIGLAHYKTNRDYVREVRTDKPLHAYMTGLTNSFERHWYGFQPAENTDWETFRQGYKQAVHGRQ